jgi:hypothetical protein
LLLLLFQRFIRHSFLANPGFSLNQDVGIEWATLSKKEDQPHDFTLMDNLYMVPFDSAAPEAAD